jgi:hypothetical protein
VLHGEHPLLGKQRVPLGSARDPSESGFGWVKAKDKVEHILVHTLEVMVLANCQT